MPDHPLFLLAYGFLFGIGFALGTLTASIIISPFIQEEDD